MNADTFKQRVSAACDDKAKAAGRALTPPEVADIAAEVFAATATPKANRAAHLSDADWTAALQADPRFQHLDIRHEISRCDHWSRRTHRVAASRARILNWLNKAEQVRAAKAAGATYANGLRPPPPVGPPGWLEWFAGEFAKVAEDNPAHGQLLSAHLCRAFHMLPASWRARARTECSALAAAP